jgi:hypothetical protein
MNKLAAYARDKAGREAAPGYEADAEAEVDAVTGAATQDYWTSRGERTQGLLNRNAASAFFADSSRSSFSAGRMAEVDGIYRQAMQASNTALNNNRQADANTILGTARNDLNAAKNDLFSSTTTFSGSINRVATGGNSGETNELLRSIDSKLDALKDIGKAH